MENIMESIMKNTRTDQCVVQRLNKVGIIPVVTLYQPEADALPLCEALSRGGIDVVEITFRSEGAEKAIESIKKAFPDMIVGAGTVLNEKQAKIAEDTGADFIVTPGFDEKTVEYCKRKKIPVFPGCITPTEYQMAVACGLEAVKFFPAEQAGGVAMIKALSGPFPTLKVIPTGGVSLDNIESYISCPNVLACGGSYMVAQKLIESKQWDKVEEICRWSIEKVKEARRNA